jgi:hypothetical protein
MIAMVAGGTRLSVCDDNRFPATTSSFSRCLDCLNCLFSAFARACIVRAELAAATALLFAVGMDRINTIPRCEQGFSAFGLTNTGTVARFSEKLGSQAEPLC